MLGQDRLGVELDAVDGEVAVGEAHDFAFGGFSGDFEAGGEGFAFDNEGVVAGGFEGARETGEDILASVENRRGFAVHEARSADDVAAVNLPNALVAEADTEDRNFSAEMPNHIATDPRIGGRAGPGGNDYFFGSELLDVGNGNLVVALHKELRTQFAKVLNEVVGERIVVIDDEDHASEEKRGLTTEDTENTEWKKSFLKASEFKACFLKKNSKPASLSFTPCSPCPTW